MAGVRFIFEVEPLDTLFFRDARPMQPDAGSGGHGARWPFPTVMHEALRTALLRRTKKVLGRKELAGHRRANRKTERWISTRDFESLRTLGPLPLRNGSFYLPAPADVVPSGDGEIAVLSPASGVPGSANYPADWLLPVTSTVVPGKALLSSWVSTRDFQRLLSLKPDERIEHSGPAVLWHAEHRIGVGIDPSTRAAKKGLLYTSEHLRPADGLRLWIAAELNPTPDRAKEELDWLRACAGECLQLGGESRLCRLLTGESDLLSQVPSPKLELGRDLKPVFRLKWVLASPGVFTGGWLPNWIRPSDGQVLLPQGDVGRREGESRLDWRLRVRKASPLNAKLVAVCSGKPAAFSGWDLAAGKPEGMGEPKPTLLAVPAGSVYYFEAFSREDAEALTRALHGRTRSDLLGEKGMGLGFCGAWEPLSMSFLESWNKQQ